MLSQAVSGWSREAWIEGPELAIRAFSFYDGRCDGPGSRLSKTSCLKRRLDSPALRSSYTTHAEAVVIAEAIAGLPELTARYGKA